jgi:proton-translocating NADH-quinone oxidoreductase chain L
VSNFFVNNAWLVPFLPLAGGLTAAVGGRWLKEQAHWPVVVGIGLAFLVSLGLLGAASSEAHTVVFDWLQAGSLHVPVEFRVDGLTTMMLSMVTFVSTLVAIFAIGYMQGEVGYPRFFAVVGLFVFSMTGLVLSGNYLLTYAFWEGVGVCSYLLIGFWHSKPSAAAAAKKAFMVNRIGDVGFAIAIFWMWSVSRNHDLSYNVFLGPDNLGGNITGTMAFGIGALLLWAATAKSAQVPLYVWLPDAMEGPTPVSALIHAATMVTAGVYLIARSMPLLVRSPMLMVIICVIGCVTALLAALIALTQTDLKRVLAYSTVSQLGYMFMALGSGVGDIAQFAMVAAMFHLFTHAFFKALLFLGSGSVMLSMGHVIDMRRFRGLRHRMPITCGTFAVGALALSGIWPFAGFFSKDEILVALKSAAVWMESDEGIKLGWVYTTIYWIAIFTAFLTAFYTGRAFFWTFFGPEKLPSPNDPEAEHDDHGHDDHAHGPDPRFGQESGLVMTVPLMILAVCALLAGLVFGWTGIFERHLEKTTYFESLIPRAVHVAAAGHEAAHAGLAHAPAGWTPLFGLIAGVAGIALAYVLYANPSPIPAQMAGTFGRAYRASLNKFYVDETYEKLVIRPLTWAMAIARFLDDYLVRGLVLGVSWIPRIIGRYLLAPFQNGLVQFYAGVTAAGVVILLWILLLN